MANIPSIPVPAPVSSIDQGTKIDPRTQLALIGQTADTFNTALGVVSEYEQRKQKAEEVAGFNQASIVLNKATADYQHNLKTMPDKDIVPKWEENAAKVKDTVMQNMSGWSPSAKRKMAQHLDTWASDSTIQFQVAGDHLASERRKATAVAAAHEFLQTGDPAFLENAKQAITAAKDAGDMTPQEAETHIGALQLGLELNQVQINMEQDPFSMKATLEAKDDSGKYENFTAIPAHERASLLFRANRLSNETRAQTMRDWTQQIADARENGGTLPDRPTMEMEAKRQGISPKWVEKALAPPKPELDTTQYAHDVVELNHLNLHDDPDGKNYARATAIVSGYKGTAATNLEKIVEEKRNVAHASNSPAATEIFSQMRGMQQAGVFLPRETGQEAIPGTGLFGTSWLSPDKKTVMKPEPVVNNLAPKWRESAPKAVLDAEADHYASALTKMRAFIKANPTATDEQLTNYSHELTKPYIMATVGSMITPQAPGAAYQTTKDVGDAFRAGKISRKEAADILKSQFHLE